MIRIVETDECPADFACAEPESGDFLRAFQAACIGDFRFGYLLAYRGDTRVSMVPYFLTEYRLNTLVTDRWLKRLLAPFGFRVACVGHPSTDEGRIEGEVSAEVLQAVNRVLRGKGAAIAYKWFSQALPLDGFVEVSGLPINVLAAGADYPAGLSRNVRRNVARKLRKSASLDFREYTPQNPLPPEVVSDVLRLYEKTAARGELQFEHLNAEYFRLTAPLSTYLLAFEGGQLIGFVQWLRNGARMSGKYIGMDYARNRQYDLYFGMVLQSVLRGVAGGVREFDLGVSSYYSKRLIGAVQRPTRLYFRHYNALMQALLGRCRFLLEPSAEELA
jgi:hypothetical protein